METKFQTSFIPKTSIVPPSEFHPRKQNSLLLVISFFIFLVSVLLGGLSFGYGRYLESQKLQITNDIQKNVQYFEEDTIRRYARLDQKIDSAKTLFEKHIALSYFLDFLSQETLKSVRFLDFSYILDQDEQTANVTLNAQASGYNAVAYQAQLLGKQSSLKKIIFSNLDLDKSGNVVFKLALTLDPKFVYFKKNITDFMKETNTN